MNDTATDTTTSTKPKRWYIVHAYSNFENKVADSIREQAKQRGLYRTHRRSAGAQGKGHRGKTRA